MLATLNWYPTDTWIVVLAAVSAVSCAVLGVFLVLRRMSLMGDALSHAVLPGIAAAFLASGTRDPLIMLIGAALIGVLTAVLVEALQRTGKLESGAAMGVVFTSLFALGLVMIRQAASYVDLDPDCVLFGNVSLAAISKTSILGLQLPRTLVMSGSVLLINLIFVAVMYKELKISAFDSALATAQGISARVMHYLLMTLVAITTVAAFESVGSILVIAMLIVPAATAQLLTDRLSVMIVLAAGLAIMAAFLGHVAAITTPAWLGFGAVSAETSGMMGVVAGLLFLGAWLLAPRQGLVMRELQQWRLSAQIAREDLLGWLYREQEPGMAEVGSERDPARALAVGRFARWAAPWTLRRAGLIAGSWQAPILTERGRRRAARLVRAHRLWEQYLTTHNAQPLDAVHMPAHLLEHVTDEQLSTRLASSVGDPDSDPHGARIPRTTSESSPGSQSTPERPE